MRIKLELTGGHQDYGHFLRREPACIIEIVEIRNTGTPCEAQFWT